MEKPILKSPTAKKLRKDMRSELGIPKVITCVILFIMLFDVSLLNAQTTQTDTSKSKSVTTSKTDDEYQKIREQAKQQPVIGETKPGTVLKPADTIRKAQPVIIKRKVVINQDYIGFNTSPMLQQLLPFNAVPADADLMTLNFRRYKNNKGYRFAMGINDLTINSNVQSLAMYYDYDNRKSMGGKWSYFLGYGIGFEFFQDNSKSNGVFFASQGFTDFLFTGHWGLEYKVNEVFSLSTESLFELRLGSSGGMRLVPPVAIVANFNITKAR